MVTRTNELKSLEVEYAKSGNSLHFVYGRLGCDKELLFRLFAKGKKAFYYRARQCSLEKQLQHLENLVEQTYDVKLNNHTYDECFTRIKSGDASKLVVIIDEAQYALKKDGAFLNSLLALKNHKLYVGPVMIIVASSSIVWSESTFDELTVNCKKQFDSVIKLNDVTFLDIVRAFPEYTVAECVSTYGILGGVSAYLNRWNGKKTIKENICNNILRPSGYLFNEAEAFISSELRELSCYDTILYSIASGHEKLNDLFEDTGYSRAKISVYMKNLAAFDVIEKVVSFETGGWDNAKKGVYRIASPFINFWFTFIYPNLSEVYFMPAEEFYDKYIAPGLDEYLSRYFANVCREYLHLLNKVGQLPIKLESIGTWVGKDGVIDVIGQSLDRRNVVGVCNWNEAVMPYSTYEKLQDSMKKARISATTIYLFSATSFDEELVALSKTDDKVVLVDMTEL